MADKKKIPSRPPAEVMVENFRTAMKPASKSGGIDPEDVPEMRKEDFRAAVRLRDIMPDVVEAMKRGRGRPKAEHPKARVSLRLEPGIIEAYRATGAGWQGRIERTLKAGAHRLARQPKKAARARR